MISAAVPTVMADTLTHAITLMALVDFFALKYLHANVKYKLECGECDKWGECGQSYPSSSFFSSFSFLKISSILNTWSRVSSR